jgi:hypothetical protein
MQMANTGMASSHGLVKLQREPAPILVRRSRRHLQKWYIDEIENAKNRNNTIQEISSYAKYIAETYAEVPGNGPLLKRLADSLRAEFDVATRLIAESDAEASEARFLVAQAVDYTLSACIRLVCIQTILNETAIVSHVRSIEGARSSGKTRAARYRVRNRELADEFLHLKPGSRKTPSALKAEIGKKAGLGRSAAIAAIDRGLKDRPATPPNRTT